MFISAKHRFSKYSQANNECLSLISTPTSLLSYCPFAALPPLALKILSVHPTCGSRGHMITCLACTPDYNHPPTKALWLFVDKITPTSSSNIFYHGFYVHCLIYSAPQIYLETLRFRELNILSELTQLLGDA